jgi:hypothetical protein
VSKKYLILLTILFFPVYTWALKTSVVLESGGTKELRENVEVVLTNILNECNKQYELGRSLESIREYFTPSAFQQFNQLVQNTQLYALQREYKTHLLKNDNGYYEVRDIKVRVFMGSTEGTPYQYLVFALNQYELVVSAHFAIEKHNYKDIIQWGKALKDLANREKILNFIELYRTAYNRKDLNFIKETLSDDALIIVGYVIQTEKSEIDYLEKSYLSSEKIQLVRLSKPEYLKRLEEVFQRNDFVNVEFDTINIQRHPLYPRIYGVQLKQHWNSSTYNDVGYLFLMIDFIHPEAPIIHVRAWQPQRFDDGSIISIYDFEIVEASENY